MFKNLNQEAGFTLIELLAVIVIIGVLIAVAAPSFLGQQKKAQDSGAKHNLAVLYRAAKTEASQTSNADYPEQASLVTKLQAAEPQFGSDIVAAPSTPADPVGSQFQVTASGDDLTLRTLSQSNKVVTLTSTDKASPVTTVAP